MNSNPLLKIDGLPIFSEIRPEQVLPAIEIVLQENRQALTALIANIKQPSWQNLMDPLDALENRLDKVWSPVRHLNSVMNTEALRDVHDQCLDKLSDYHTEIGQNELLYQLFKQLAQNARIEKLDSTQEKILQDALLGFELSGVHLPTDKKQRFKTIQQKLSQLQSKFEQNVLDATLAWQHHERDIKLLKGLPESALAMAAQKAQQANKIGYLFDLQFPSYIAVMTYADNRELRKLFYTAYNTRASTEPYDNSSNIDEILALRHELAQLLGYANYAEKSVVTKMAESPTEVIQFLMELAERAKPQAQQEWKTLQDYAEAELKGEALQSWDVSYYSEKLREELFGISDEALKPWFPAERVIAGMFEVVQRLYGLTIQAAVADTWHADVRFYEIRDAAGVVRGQFYLDLYARQFKRGGAWMDECQNRYLQHNGLQLPVAYLTCNLTAPIGKQPAMFTHDEVTTLFHEFGHGLHHMLTQIDYPSVSGIHGVEWDAVELPSQFMENWCWEIEALAFISGHYETGEPLSADVIQKLRDARNFQAAMQTMRQIEFSLFDLRIHGEYTEKNLKSVQVLLDEIRQQVAVNIPPVFVRFQNSFGHIFAGGYAAGYYSYKWAEVLSADAFSKFEENGIFDRATGTAFMQNILERGGSRKAMELFEMFRGRKPSIEPLLRHTGLAA
ncbi:MAG: M3 family metallopeptidase [Gammaproteobacteria bacterium]|nr:M3 family metallopeptidase [Gammaproteobacteria bacterium]